LYRSFTIGYCTFCSWNRYTVVKVSFSLAFNLMIIYIIIIIIIILLLSIIIILYYIQYTQWRYFQVPRLYNMLLNLYLYIILYFILYTVPHYDLTTFNNYLYFVRKCPILMLVKNLYSISMYIGKPRFRVTRQTSCIKIVLWVFISDNFEISLI